MVEGKNREKVASNKVKRNTILQNVCKNESKLGGGGTFFEKNGCWE